MSTKHVPDQSCPTNLYKEHWNEDCLKLVCGLANDSETGGRLLIGFTSLGKLIGIPDADTLADTVQTQIRQALGLALDVRTETTDAGLTFISIDVAPSHNPVSYRGTYYLKSGDVPHALEGESLRMLMNRKLQRSYDSVPVPGLKLQDFDDAALNDFRKKAKFSGRLSEAILSSDTHELLSALNLSEGDDYTHAAALLFHPDPERFVTGAYIKVGFFGSIRIWSFKTSSTAVSLASLRPAGMFSPPNTCDSISATKAPIRTTHCRWTKARSKKCCLTPSFTKTTECPRPFKFASLPIVWKSSIVAHSLKTTLSKVCFYPAKADRETRTLPMRF